MAPSGRAQATAGARTLREDPDVRLAFTDRAFGNVSVAVGNGEPAAARGRLLRHIGLRPGDGVFMEQVHGARVARVGTAHRGRGLAAHTDALRGVDALVTTDPGVGLVVLVADCVPLLLAVPGRGVGAVHAGRRGVAAGIVGATVAALVEAADAPPSEIMAVSGPAIGGCCYELPTHIAREVLDVAPSALATTRWGTEGVDLPAAVGEQLHGAGVTRVERAGVCTACHADRWFSHRATTAGRAPAGRQAAVIARVPGSDEPPFLH